MGKCISRRYDFKNAIYINTLSVAGRATLERCVIKHKSMECLTKTVIRKVIPRHSLHYEDDFLYVLEKLQAHNPRRCAKIIHVIQRYDSIEVFMPFYGKIDMFEFVEKISTLPTLEFRETCIPYIIKIAKAIRNLHSISVIHGDIKLENMMLYKNDIILIDFDGASCQSYNNRRHSAATLAYAAPEKVQHGHICLANDVWSFGVTVFAIFEGYMPFTKMQLRTCRDGSTRIHLECEVTPPWILPILINIFNICPENRPTMDQVVTRLINEYNIKK